MQVYIILMAGKENCFTWNGFWTEQQGLGWCLCEIPEVYANYEQLKVGLSSSKNVFFIFFNDSHSKMMKNVFYFILKALFVLKTFNFLSWLFGYVEKTAWLERKG